MRRPQRDELGPALSPRREPLQRVLKAADEQRAGAMTVSLQSKITLGYVALGASLFVALHYVQERTWQEQVAVAAGITFTLALGFPALLARVRRLKVLSRSALEISRGDLSKPVDTNVGTMRDEIDELSVAINTMQENLRELVGHIQHTA